ncbi:MAG: type II toxin-antitoxin system mRNA interferase toxin, RelE/StbE family [Thioploca sp.]|nr:type II toxin-antitoxin system mRNA interferase toxin, RelE/StbE family [Thioploca sp.]
MKIAFSPVFERSFRKRFKGKRHLQERFWQRVEIFLENPFDSRLRTHKLTGNLKELWSFSVEYDTRVVFYFVTDEKVVFVDVGTHDEVY